VSQWYLSGLFAISSLDHTSARITAALPLRALYGNYSLVIRASDLGSPPNSAVDTVKICVTDFNDHPPRFVSPPANLTIIRVPEVHVSSIVAMKKNTIYLGGKYYKCVTTLVRKLTNLQVQ
jgi:hypothetical protein